MVIGLDGNWKISRNKCLYHKKVVLTEFHPIRTGCQDTTNRKSYFCKNHIRKRLFYPLFLFVNMSDLNSLKKNKS